MAASQSFSTDLGLGVLPEIDQKKDPSLFNELTRLRSAIRSLASTLDIYTGGSPNGITTPAVTTNKITTPVFNLTVNSLAFYGVALVARQTTAVASATFVAGVGVPFTPRADDTYDGYTLAQIVKALKIYGLLT